MKVLDKIKQVFNKNTTQNTSQNEVEKEQFIKLYQELEKEGFSISKKRDYLGTFMDMGDSFAGYNVTTTLFKDGVLIIDSHSEREIAGQDIKKENQTYTIVAKDEKGEFIVLPRAKIDIFKVPNIDMRCLDTHVTLNGQTINMDAHIYNQAVSSLTIPKEFKLCYQSVNKLNETEELYDETQDFFAEVIDGVENGSIKAKIKAKCVCVDARKAKAEEVGTKFTVWSNGKVEKEIVVKEDTVFLTTLDRNGNPIVDEKGHENTYDMPLAKFSKKYKKHANGHYVQDTTPMITIQLPDSMIPEEGKKLLPPCWGGYEGTLMRGGLIMLPFNPELSREEQIAEWKKYLQSNVAVDWYPNNEAQTYATCDRNGVFKDADLRELYGQEKTEEHTV